MNIAIFSDSYRPSINGVVTSITLFARELRAMGHKVYIFGPTKRGFHEEDFFALPSVKLPRHPDFRIGLPFSVKLFKRIPQVPIDIVHVQSPGPIGLLGVAYAVHKHLPRVVTYHFMMSDYARYYVPYMPLVHLFADFWDKFFFNRFHAVTAPTPAVRDYLKKIGIKQTVNIIPTGIDTRAFKDVEPARELLKIKQNGKFLIGVASRLATEKNIDFLLEAFAILHSMNEQTHFCVIGGGQHLRGLRRHVNKLNLSDHVTFTDFVQPAEMPKYFAALDVFAYACETDTQGMVVMEAMAAGKPLVLINSPVFKPFVDEGKNGFLLSKDPYLFAREIQRILRDTALLQKMSEHSRQKAQGFSITTQAKVMEKLYKDTLAARQTEHSLGD